MIVFLCILGVLLLLCLPVSALVQWEQELQVTAHYLFLNIPVFPQKKKIKHMGAGKKKTKGEEPRKPPKEEKPKPPMPLEDKIDMLLNLVQAATGGLRMLLHNLCIRNLTLHVTVAAQDAAAVAIEYGRMNATIYGAYATLENYIRLKKTSITVQPDFAAEQGALSLRLTVQLTPLVALAAGVRMFVEFLWANAQRA